MGAWERISAVVLLYCEVNEGVHIQREALSSLDDHNKLLVLVGCVVCRGMVTYRLDQRGLQLGQGLVDRVP